MSGLEQVRGPLVSVREFAEALAAERERAELSLRRLAEVIGDRRAGSGAVAMDHRTLGELAGRGKRVRLPTEAQLRTILTACRSSPDLTRHLIAARADLAGRWPTDQGRRSRERADGAPTRPGPVPLGGFELVAHVFVAAAGPHVAARYADLLATWRRCAEEWGLTEAIRRYPVELPVRCPAVAKDTALLAARVRPRPPGVVEVVGRRVHDVVCLSLVVAPEDGTSWADLLAVWRSVWGGPPEGQLGSAVIVQAHLARPWDELDVAALKPELASRVPLQGRELRVGTVRAEAPIGPFAVWEVVEDADDEQAVDLRTHRDLVVVAPHGREAELSAWTWSRGDRRFPPLARYLLHAAKLRYAARVWAGSSLDERRSAVEAAIDGPDRDRDVLREREARMGRARDRLAALRTTTERAARNIVAHSKGDQSGGLFLDDKGFGDWLEGLLDGDLRYVDDTLAAAQRVLAARSGDRRRS